MDLSKTDVKNILIVSKEYFDKHYENGATLQDIINHEELAFKKYINCYAKNIEQGKIRYNGECKKLRDKWFLLESIEKLLKLNNLDKVENLDFCMESLSEQTDKFYEYIQQEKYNSYIEETDLKK